MDTSPVVLVSDCHGCWFTLVRLLNQVVVAHPGARLMLLGDEIDRGPHSRQVVEFAMANAISTVMGNHIDLALAYSEHTRRGYRAKCASYYERDIWLYNGGDYALGNWPHFREGRREGNVIPKEVLDWMQALPPYIISDLVDDKGRKGLFSHTGYGLDADLNTSDGWFRALWGRHAHGDGDFPDDGYHRVFGHTQAKEVRFGEGWHMVDTGAAYKAYGNMTAFIWPTKQTVVQGFDESPCEQRFAVVCGRLTP